MSHEVVLGGKLAAKTSFSISRPTSPRVEDLKGEPGLWHRGRRALSHPPRPLSNARRLPRGQPRCGLTACPGGPQGPPCMAASGTTCSPRTSSRRTATPSRTLGGRAAPSSSQPRTSPPRIVSGLLSPMLGRGQAGKAAWERRQHRRAVQTEGLTPRHPDPLRPPHSLLQGLLPLRHGVPRVPLGPLCARRGVSLPLGTAPPEPR